MSKEQPTLENFLFSEEISDELTNESMKLFEKISQVLIEDQATIQKSFLTLSSMAEAILAYGLIHPENKNLKFEDFYKGDKNE